VRSIDGLVAICGLSCVDHRSWNNFGTISGHNEKFLMPDLLPQQFRGGMALLHSFTLEEEQKNVM